ncbi:MAG: hypothetical protein Q4F97_12255 [Bacteroidales bacterium]|nr:hypothetical protein [Bacteroidales bacterium]
MNLDFSSHENNTKTIVCISNVENLNTPLQDINGSKTISIIETAYAPIYQNGKIVKGERLEDIPIDTFIYNLNENDIKINLNDINDFKSSEDSIINKYDKNGNLIKNIIYSKDGIILFTRTNSYDSLSRISTSITRDCITEEVYTTSYNYDNKGMLRMKITNNNNQSVSMESFVYDDNGNWKVKVYFENLNPVIFIERKIEYLN